MRFILPVLNLLGILVLLLIPLESEKIIEGKDLEETRIKIIGGAEGPTTVFISESSNYKLLAKGFLGLLLTANCVYLFRKSRRVEPDAALNSEKRPAPQN